MSPDRICRRWRQLDPVFVRGMQRSGTSVMAQALRRLGIVGFGEGHLWFDLVRPFENLRDPEYRPNLRVDSYALGKGREASLEKYIAVALDQFHKDHLPKGSGRWMDKSPGAEAVRVVPLLAELFPGAQFIFMYRNGITTVHSAVRLWADHDFWSSETELFQAMCRAWADTMSSWREVRRLLPNRYIEIAQEELASRPCVVASRLAEFLGMPDARSRVADLFQTKRLGSAFPDRPAGDYDYEIKWGEERKAYFISTCGQEMGAWGFEIDFVSPGPARPRPRAGADEAVTMDALQRHEARIKEPESECWARPERVKGIAPGLLSRLLNLLETLKLAPPREDSSVGGRDTRP